MPWTKITTPIKACLKEHFMFITTKKIYRVNAVVARLASLHSSFSYSWRSASLHFMTCQTVKIAHI